MAEHQGVARVHDYLEKFAAGDMEALREFFSNDVVWHVGGYHSLSGDYVGIDALFDYFAKVRDLTGGTLTLIPESILASDRHIAMFTRVTGQRNGKSLDVVLAQGMRVGSDGKWTEYFALADDQPAVDAFWS